MARIIGLSNEVKTSTDKRGKVAVIQRAAEDAYKPLFPADIQQLLDDEVYPSLQKFLLFWVMMDAIRVHGYTRAAMSAIGRSTVGAWWQLAKHQDLGSEATEEQRIELIEFYSGTQKEWDNIRDYQGLAYKLVIGAQYLKYFGQVAFVINRTGGGMPIGFDHLPGLVIPNVDEFGYFRNPAFVQYPVKDPRIRTEFSNPRDIIYITNPDWEGSPLGGSDIEALTEFTLPLDIYLQTAAREYMKNTNRPELIYMLPSDISDEAFDTFVALLNTKYQGAGNRGKNPVAVQGELKVERVDNLPDNLPYQAARDDARDEVFASSGMSGPVLGLSGDMASANIRESRRQVHETTMEPLFRLLEEGFYDQIHVREFEAPGWDFRFNNPDFLTAVERATVHMRYKDMGVYNPNEIREQLGEEPREGGDEYSERTGNNQGSPPEGREEEPDDPSNTGEPTDDDQDPPRGDQHDDETDRSALSELEGLDPPMEPSYPEDDPAWEWNEERGWWERTPDGTTFTTETSSKDHPEAKTWAGPRIEADTWEEAEEIAATMRTEVVGELISEIKAWRKFALGRIKKGMRLRRYYTERIPEGISLLIQDRLENADDEETVREIFDDLLEMIMEISDE